MIGTDGFFDWAIRDPGPADRVRSGMRTPVTVYVLHSMEGTYAYGTPGAYIVLRDGTRYPTAWHWTKLRDGRVCQHYPSWAHLQHGHAANTLGPGGELEGFKDEPMTDAQLAAEKRIIHDINLWRVGQGLSPLERDTRALPAGQKRGLVLHREMAPGGATACPSDRYARLFPEGDDMPDPRVDKILALLGEKEIDDWLAKGNVPLLTAFASEQKSRGEVTNAMNAHKREHPVSDHQHGGVIR